MVRTVVSVDRVTAPPNAPHIVTDEATVQQHIEDLLITWFRYEPGDEEGLFHVTNVDRFKTRVDAIAERADGNIEFTVTALDDDDEAKMPPRPHPDPPLGLDIEGDPTLEESETE